MRTRRMAMSILMVAVGLEGYLLSGSASAHVPSLGAQPWQDPIYMEKQGQLLDAVTAINDAVGTDDRLLGSAISVETMTISLLWHGPDSTVMSRMQRLIPTGIRLEMENYPYDRREMDAAVDRVWSLAPQLEAESGFRVDTIRGVDRDSGSIEVLGAYPADKEGRPTVGTTQARLTQEVSAATDGHVPVRVTAHAPESVALATAGRQTDTSPFNAGAYFIDGNGIPCSSGFGIIYQGSYRSTTARHCDNTSYRPRGGTSYTYNGVTKVDAGTGIKIVSSAGSSKAFIGAYSSNSYKPVSKLVYVSLNAYVCTSGGNSGEHCGIKITDMSNSVSDGYGSFYNIEGTQTSTSAIAVAGGDSGGPVQVNATATSIGAVGIIQYQRNWRTSNCPAMRDADACGMIVGFSSIHSMFNNTGASLRTG